MGAWEKYGASGWGTSGQERIFQSNAMQERATDTQNTRFYTQELAAKVENMFRKDYERYNFDTASNATTRRTTGKPVPGTALGSSALSGRAGAINGQGRAVGGQAGASQSSRREQQAEVPSTVTNSTCRFDCQSHQRISIPVSRPGIGPQYCVK